MYVIRDVIDRSTIAVGIETENAPVDAQATDAPVVNDSAVLINDGETFEAVVDPRVIQRILDKLYPV